MEAQIVQFLWNTFIADGVLIIAAVFIMGQMVKTLPKLDKIPNDYISLLGIILGAILAVVSPEIYPLDDNITAAIKGGSLGLMTTGLYEVLKIFFPRLSAKLSEKTAEADSTLAEIVDATEQAGKQDVEAAIKKRGPAIKESKVDDFAQNLADAIVPDDEEMKSLMEEELAAANEKMVADREAHKQEKMAALEQAQDDNLEPIKTTK
jgi:hypothetical protein